MLGSLRRGFVFAGQNLLDLIKYPVNPIRAFSVHNRSNAIPSDCQRLFHAATSAQTDKLTTSNSLVTPGPSKDDRRLFEGIFHDLVKDLTDSGKNQDISEIIKRFARVLQYNVPGGKNNRAITLYNSYQLLAPNSQLTQENKRLAMTMGWCVEMLQAFVLVLDDIMDGADVRRGRPCWYRVDNIGVFAINDGILLECGVYEILRRHFRDKPYYANVLDLFHKATLQTMLGQSLDTLSCNSGKLSLENFTMKLYEAIVKYKTGYYSCYLPIALAMNMAGIEDPELHRQAKNILLKIGHLLQVQDDYLDLFGSFESTGKVGTDIQAGKCSWLAVVALQRANPEQRRIMEECYGTSEPEKVEAVRQLYESLGLPSAYKIYEKETYNHLKSLIQKIPTDLPAEIFLSMLEMFYQRSG